MRPAVLATILALLLCNRLMTTSGKEQDAGKLTTLTKEQWRQDLQYFARELPKRHKNAFHDVTREEFERMVAELDARIQSLQEDQIAVGMLQITAKVGDAHTYVHLPQPVKVYPLALYWFGNDLRVIAAAADSQRALGARLVRIGDLSISEVMTRMRSIISQAENELLVLNSSQSYITTAAALHSLGIASDPDHAKFTFEDDEGKQFTLDLQSTPATGPIKLNGLRATKEPPLYRQKPAEPFWFTYLEEPQTLYVNFKGYAALGENAKKLFDFIDHHPVKKLVIDMRQNGGGDFFEGRKHLIQPLKQRSSVSQKGRLFVITGRNTASAAMANAIDFRKELNAILVGEPIGERPNSYAERKDMKLPNSGIVVSYSTQYYKFLDEDVPAVMPDKRIDPDWQNYKAGRDPVMEWILSYADGR